MFFSTLLAFGIGGSKTLAALCDKSQQLEAITITKSSILYVAGVLVPPLKSIDKLRQRPYHLFPVFWFH